jgi:hypothetical protein
MDTLNQQLDVYGEKGYLVVPDALSTGEVDAINDAIDSDRAEDGPFWMKREDGHVELSVHMLLASPAMDVTMRPTPLLSILEAILGPDLCAEEHSVRLRHAFDGEPYCNWHRDGNGWPQLGADPAFDTHYVSVAYYLSDVDATTHTFSVLPGSAHGNHLPPLADYDLQDAHHIEGPAGTAIMFNASMFHAGNVRQSTVERRTVHMYCGRGIAPPISNFTIFPRRLTDHKDEAVRRYYGRPNPITKLLREKY